MTLVSTRQLVAEPGAGLDQRLGGLNAVKHVCNQRMNRYDFRFPTLPRLGLSVNRT